MKLRYLLTARRSFARQMLLAIPLLLSLLFFARASELPGRLRLPQSAAPPAGKSASPKAGIPAAQARADQATHARLLQNYGKLPLSFEANQGQTDARVKFLSRGRGYTLFLTADEAVLALRSGQSSVVSRQLPKTTDNGPRTTDRALGLPIDNRQPSIDNPSPPAPAFLRMTLAGANGNARAVGLDELPGKSNYFLGNDPKKWRTNVPNYAKVRYENVYPGIDLVFHGKESEVTSQEPGGRGPVPVAEHRQVEYDFVVAPGADPRAIRFAIETGNSKLENGKSKLETGNSGLANPEPRFPNPGALRIAANGDLVIHLNGGEVRFRKPLVYQPTHSATSPVNSEFRIQNSEFVEGHYVLLADNRVGFEVGNYDRSRPLIIDPILVYSTYLGGAFDEQGLASPWTLPATPTSRVKRPLRTSPRRPERTTGPPTWAVARPGPAPETPSSRN